MDHRYIVREDLCGGDIMIQHKFFFQRVISFLNFIIRVLEAKKMGLLCFKIFGHDMRVAGLDQHKLNWLVRLLSCLPTPFLRINQSLQVNWTS
jgi:hypothetical protein